MASLPPDVNQVDIYDETESGSESADDSRFEFGHSDFFHKTPDGFMLWPIPFEMKEDEVKEKGQLYELFVFFRMWFTSFLEEFHVQKRTYSIISDIVDHQETHNSFSMMAMAYKIVSLNIHALKVDKYQAHEWYNYLEETCFYGSRPQFQNTTHHVMFFQLGEKDAVFIYILECGYKTRFAVVQKPLKGLLIADYMTFPGVKYTRTQRESEIGLASSVQCRINAFQSKRTYQTPIHMHLFQANINPVTCDNTRHTLDIVSTRNVKPMQRKVKDAKNKTDAKKGSIQSDYHSKAQSIKPQANAANTSDNHIIFM